MDVSKVIVHSLDAHERRMVLAQAQVNLNSSKDIEDLILKLTKSFQSSSGISRAILDEDSPLQNLIGQQFDFMEYSKSFAKTWFQSAMLSEDYLSSNLIFAQVDQGDTALLVCLEMRNRSAYIKIDGDFVHNDSVWNATFSNVKSGFVLDLNEGVLLVKTLMDTKDLMEATLMCELKANSRETFQVVDTLVDAISEQRNERPLMNTLRVKQVVTDNQNFIDTVRPDDLVRAVFEDLSETELSLIHASLEEHHAEDDIVLKDLRKTTIASKHKIITESGIEIIVPIDSVDISRILSVVEDDEGQTNIILNNIGKIIT